MTSANSRRRRDVKTQDREKSLSPLDKDHLKQRCLERVRSERRRLMARMRERRALGEDEFANAETTAVNPLEAAGASAGAGNPSLPLGYSLSSAREILKHGLNEIAAGNQRTHEQPSPEDEAAAAGSGQTGEENPSWRISRISNPQIGALPAPQEEPWGESQSESQSQSQSHLMAFDEETAYFNACSGGRCTGTPQRASTASVAAAAAAGGGRAGTPASAAGHSPFMPGSGNLDGEYQLFAGVAGAQRTSDKGGGVGEEWRPTPMADGDDGWDDSSDVSDEARLLSPDEYLEMMQYIEGLCREEDLRAEAEVSYAWSINVRLSAPALGALKVLRFHACVTAVLRLRYPYTRTCLVSGMSPGEVSGTG